MKVFWEIFVPTLKTARCDQPENCNTAVVALKT